MHHFMRETGNSVLLKRNKLKNQLNLQVNIYWLWTWHKKTTLKMLVITLPVILPLDLSFWLNQVLFAMFSGMPTDQNPAIQNQTHWKPIEKLMRLHQPFIIFIGKHNAFVVYHIIKQGTNNFHYYLMFLQTVLIICCAREKKRKREKLVHQVILLILCQTSFCRDFHRMPFLLESSVDVIYVKTDRRLGTKLGPAIYDTSLTL